MKNVYHFTLISEVGVILNYVVANEMEIIIFAHMSLCYHMKLAANVVMKRKLHAFKKALMLEISEI